MPPINCTPQSCRMFTARRPASRTTAKASKNLHPGLLFAAMRHPRLQYLQALWRSGADSCVLARNCSSESWCTSGQAHCGFGPQQQPLQRRARVRSQKLLLLEHYESKRNSSDIVKWFGEWRFRSPNGYCLRYSLPSYRMRIFIFRPFHRA